MHISRISGCGVRALKDYARRPPLPVCFNALNELSSELTVAEESRQVTAPAVTQIKKGRLTRPFSAVSWITTLSNP
jgi:hypothetical protein